jgi:catechol 2,3-dioxygenase-like lactoylglutathione lyase family enzyme
LATTGDDVRLQKVNHLTYNVTDKERALRFWEDVLGVRQIPSQVSERADRIVWLQLPSGTMVHLVVDPEAPSTPSHHGAFEVDDIEATARALQAKGVETTPFLTRDDGQRAFFLHDPDGNRIEICTKSGFGVLV